MTTHTPNTESSDCEIALSGRTAELLTRLLVLKEDEKFDSFQSVYSLLNILIERLSTLRSCGFLSGITGVAWAVALAHDHPPLAMHTAKLLKELDNLLYRVSVSRHADELNPDGTLIGCMLFFLARTESESNQTPYQLIAHKEALILMANDLHRILIDSKLLDCSWSELSAPQQRSLLSAFIVASLLNQTSLNPRLSLRMLFLLKSYLMPQINAGHSPSVFDQQWRYMLYLIGISANDHALEKEVETWWTEQQLHYPDLSTLTRSSEMLHHLSNTMKANALRKLLPLLPDPRIALFILMNNCK